MGRYSYIYLSYETDTRIDIPLKNAVDIKILDLDSRFLVHLAQPEAISTFPTIQYFIKGKKKMQMLSLPSLVMLSQCLMIIIIIVIIIVIGYIFAITSQTRLRTVSHPLLIVVEETKTQDRSIPISLQNRGCAAAQCPSVGVPGSAWPDVSRLMQIAQPELAMASSNQALCFIPTSNQFQCKLSGPGQQPPAAASETPTPPHLIDII